MCLINDTHLQLHAPKTAGTWAGSVFVQACGADYIEGLPHRIHSPIASVPAELLATRKVWGTVRNPWAWYVSWYLHVRNTFGAEPLQRMTGGPSDFLAVMARATAMTDCATYPANPAHMGMTPGDDWQASGMGLCSWVARCYYSGRVPVTLLDAASISTTLPGYLDTGLDPDVLTDKHPPMNTAKGRWKNPNQVQPPNEYADWYDDCALARVWDADRWLIDLMAYEGPFEPAHGPIKVLRPALVRNP